MATECNPRFALEVLTKATSERDDEIEHIIARLLMELGLPGAWDVGARPWMVSQGFRQVCHGLAVRILTFCYILIELKG